MPVWRQTSTATGICRDADVLQGLAKPTPQTTIRTRVAKGWAKPTPIATNVATTPISNMPGMDQNSIKIAMLHDHEPIWPPASAFICMLHDSLSGSSTLLGCLLGRLFGFLASYFFAKPICAHSVWMIFADCVRSFMSCATRLAGWELALFTHIFFVTVCLDPESVRTFHFVACVA